MAIDTDDIELDMSTSASEFDDSTPAVDAALSDDADTAATPSGGEVDDQQAPNTARQGDPQSKTSESEKTRADDAIAFLSGKDKRERAKETKDQAAKTEDPASKQTATTKDQKPPAKPAKTDPKANDGLTAEERAAMPEKTRQRFDKLLSERKTATAELTKIRTEYDQAKPDIERGQVFSQVIDEFKLADDIAVCQDEDVAGAVRFQASLARLSSGKGTQTDLDRCRTVFEQLDKDRTALGLAPEVAAAPTVDTKKLEEALAKAEADLDFDDLRKAITGLKTEKPKAAAATTTPSVRVQPQVQIQQQAPAAPAEDPDDRLYEARAIRHIQAAGQQASPEYFKTALYPRILADLRRDFPQDNPAQRFAKLSPRARFDLTVEAFDALQKQTAATKPKPKAPAPQHRAVAAGGTKPAWAESRQNASSSAAAIDFLSGS